MGRPHVILQSEYAYTISARCINREWFYLPMEQVWNIFCEELTSTHFKHGLRIHSFVLMNNHFHLIARTPKANISECMHYFMKRTSLRLARAGNRINETFAGRHYKCILQSHTYFLNAYKYNYRNPVAAGLCDRVEDYAFSTLQSVINPANKILPLEEDESYASDPNGILGWLNLAPDPLKWEAAQLGFRRNRFSSKKCRHSNRPILGEFDLL